jgi:hypothetical protein
MLRIVSIEREGDKEYKVTFADGRLIFVTKGELLSPRKFQEAVLLQIGVVYYIPTYEFSDRPDREAWLAEIARTLEGTSV